MSGIHFLVIKRGHYNTSAKNKRLILISDRITNYFDKMNISIQAGGSDRDLYDSLFDTVSALLEGENDLTANLANVSAVIKEMTRLWWVGFYLVKEGQLVLGPFQGPVACTRIPFDKGVCGACYSSRQTIVVEDVEKFPGHIACSAASRSEMVVPVFHRNGTVAMVLDLDSEYPARFQASDQAGMERIARLIERKL